MAGATRLFDLVEDVRLAVCGDVVGMAMVAQTCRWAVRHWRTRPARTMSLLEAAIQHGHIHIAYRSLRRDDIGMALSVVDVYRSMIRALHRGYMFIFNGVMAICEYKCTSGIFVSFCLAEERALFLSQPIDMRLWFAEMRYDVWYMFCAIAWPARDMQIICHVAGPSYTHLQLPLTYDNMKSVADTVDSIEPQAFGASGVDAIVALIACNGDALSASMILARREAKRWPAPVGHA